MFSMKKLDDIWVAGPACDKIILPQTEAEILDFMKNDMHRLFSLLVRVLYSESSWFLVALSYSLMRCADNCPCNLYLVFVRSVLKKRASQESGVRAPTSQGHKGVSAPAIRGKRV